MPPALATPLANFGSVVSAYPPISVGAGCSEMVIEDDLQDFQD